MRKDKPARDMRGRFTTGSAPTEAQHASEHPEAEPVTGRHAYEIEDAQGPQAPSFPAFTHEDGSYSPLRGRHLFGSGVDVTVERAHDARAFRMNGYQEKHGHRYSRGGANGNRLPAMGEADVSYTD